MTLCCFLNINVVLQIEEYSRKQAELESKLNVANKRVSVWNHSVLILAKMMLLGPEKPLF